MIRELREEVAKLQALVATGGVPGGVAPSAADSAQKKQGMWQCVRVELSYRFTFVAVFGRLAVAQLTIVYQLLLHCCSLPQLSFDSGVRVRVRCVAMFVADVNQDDEDTAARLAETERLMEELRESREDKENRAKHATEEREAALREMGIALKGDGGAFIASVMANTPTQHLCY